MNDFTMKELTLEDLHPDLLQSFNRYQEVQRCWRMENGEWILKDLSFTEQWDDSLKKEIINDDFTNCLKSGGFVWGVFNNDNELVAFASLLSDFFGSENQYLQLMQIHVSYEYRSKGIGRELFALCSEKARKLGAKKLYISTHSSEESQHFYKKVGCVDAEEINKKLAEYEPYDRQMEFIL
ncbi:GNAT family N-acetyltransferase [Paenibacillus sp. D2_2]|uniref:GNAT family N-acetyltransferase n=1 Tax=Paenibacillus sp. D2_2 TaxID=3073092 RepID=UPI0028162181|nr:GNAT family N-acetyltransferase [Paenibacillus sp. D2_2]WMT41278.1 GNAT family N-acetyltransferase [Paenibacillus sp. D2_2]